jgi:hypothetical protein
VSQPRLGELEDTPRAALTVRPVTDVTAAGHSLSALAAESARPAAVDDAVFITTAEAKAVITAELEKLGMDHFPGVRRSMWSAWSKSPRLKLCERGSMGAGGGRLAGRGKLDRYGNLQPIADPVLLHDLIEGRVNLALHVLGLGEDESGRPD